MTENETKFDGNFRLPKLKLIFYKYIKSRNEKSILH